MVTSTVWVSSILRAKVGGGCACAYLVALPGTLHVAENVEQNYDTDTNQGDEKEKKEAEFAALGKRVGTRAIAYVVKGRASRLRL